MINVYGSSGFVGGNFVKKYPELCIINSKDENTPKSRDILYLISTVDNYNVYTDPYLDINTNLIKLIKVLEECKNKDIVFNFVSSWFVYGKTNALPATEESLCNPTGFYSITKRTAEQLLISYCQTFNINYRILRLTNIIGKDDLKVSKKKNALQYMFNCLKNNEKISLYDGGSNVRDYMHVKDACRAIKCVLDNAPLNEIVNISNCQPKQIGELIHYAKDKINSKSIIENIKPTDFHNIVQIKDMWLDNRKLLSYGYLPSINVFESIDDIMEKT